MLSRQLLQLSLRLLGPSSAVAFGTPRTGFSLTWMIATCSTKQTSAWASGSKSTRCLNPTQLSLCALHPFPSMARKVPRRTRELRLRAALQGVTKGFTSSAGPTDWSTKIHPVSVSACQASQPHFSQCHVRPT